MSQSDKQRRYMQSASAAENIIKYYKTSRLNCIDILLNLVLIITFSSSLLSCLLPNSKEDDLPYFFSPVRLPNESPEVVCFNYHETKKVFHPVGCLESALTFLCNLL